MTSKTRCTSCLRLSCFALITAVLAGILGCDNEGSLNVSGHVRYEDEPIEDGVIKFQSEAGRYAAARIKNGGYTIDDTSRLEPGKYTVKITAQRQAGTRTAKETTLAHNAGDVVPVIEQYIPAQYNEESTLTVTFENGKSDFDFDLTPPDSGA